MYISEMNAWHYTLIALTLTYAESSIIMAKTPATVSATRACHH